MELESFEERVQKLKSLARDYEGALIGAYIGHPGREARELTVEAAITHIATGCEICNRSFEARKRRKDEMRDPR